jgi:hypothetical protein
MNKISFFTLLLVFISFNVQSQYSYNGIRTSKRAGILGATINPAELANMSQKVDVHIVGFDLNVANNVVNLTPSTFGNMDSFVDRYLNKVSPEGLTFRVNIDVMGPGGAYAINDKMTAGLFSRARIQMAMNNIDIVTGKALASSETVENASLPYTTPTINNMSMNLVGWTELGGSFAMNLYDSKEHSFSGGATIKALFLGGYANAFLTNFRATVDTVPGGNVRISNGSGDIGMEHTGSNDPLEDLGSNFFGSPKGIGFDIGASYQFKDKNSGNYLLKVGASIVDIGSISASMNAQNSRSFRINPITNFDPSTIQGDNMDDIINNIKTSGIATEVPIDSTQSISLPTAFNLTADWNVWKSFYLTAHMQRPMTKKDNPRSLIATDFISFTPRISFKIFEAYMPISFSSLQGTNLGLGFKLGPMYLGTGSLLSAMFSESNKAVDFHFGFKAGFGKRSKKANNASTAEPSAPAATPAQTPTSNPKVGN